MKPIKTKTHYNFMRVVRMIQKKGYDFDESVRVAQRIFDQYQYEDNQLGLSVLQMVDQIIEMQ